MQPAKKQGSPGRWRQRPSQSPPSRATGSISRKRSTTLPTSRTEQHRVERLDLGARAVAESGHDEPADFRDLGLQPIAVRSRAIPAGAALGDDPLRADPANGIKQPIAALLDMIEVEQARAAGRAQ